MTMLVARLLILAAAGGALALGLPREWVDPLVSDPEVAIGASAALTALWAGLWRLATVKGWAK